MDPFTLILLAGVGWAVTAPDKRTLRATRGGAGSARAAARGFGRGVRAEWAAGRPKRLARATNRRKLWWKRGGGWRAAVTAERAAIWTARAALGTGRTLLAGARAGVREARAAYGPAAEAAQIKRSEKREAKRERERAAGIYQLADLIPAQATHDVLSPTGDGQNDTKETNVNASPTTGGDLTSLGELNAETVEIRAALENALPPVKEVHDWTVNLLERYAAAPFGDAQLTKAVTAVAELSRALGDAVQALSLTHEATALLSAEIENAHAAAEALVARGADADAQVAAYA